MNVAANNPCMCFNDVSLGYSRSLLLSDVTFTIGAGEYFGIVGPNGSGKTTIVRALLGMIQPKAGSISASRADGSPLRFGYVPQRDTIECVLPYSVHQVVMMGRYKNIGLLRRPNAADRARVIESLGAVGIQELSDTLYKELSGGQRQRSLIARALASDPDVLVLDEPTNGMDLASRASILQLIHTLHVGRNLTVILITHDLADVAQHTRRIALVENGSCTVGETESILTEERLSLLYGMPISVSLHRGVTIIRAGGADVAR